MIVATSKVPNRARTAPTRPNRAIARSQVAAVLHSAQQTARGAERNARHHGPFQRVGGSGDEWRHRAQARRGRAPVVAEPPRRQRPVHGHGLLVTVTAAVAGVPAFLFGQLVQGCHDHLASGGLEVASDRLLTLMKKD